MVCVLRFSRTFLGKYAKFQNMCAKNRNDFRQLKRSNFRVEKCKTEENLSKYLNSMVYKTVTSMRDCVMKRIFCKTWIVFILIKCICFIINLNHVWSCVKKHCFKKKIHCFPKNPLFSNMCAFLSPRFETKNYHWLGLNVEGLTNQDIKRLQTFHIQCTRSR